MDVFRAFMKHIVFELILTVRKYTLRDNLYPFVQGKILDVGCWEGDVSHELLLLDQKRPNSKIDSIMGIEPYLLPPNPKIPVTPFDGLHIPFEDKEFDMATCITVLHHSKDQEAVIKEMKRVAKRIVIVEDSFETPSDRESVIRGHDILNFTFGMDYEPNGFHSSNEWKQIFTKHDLKVVHEELMPSNVPFNPLASHYIFVLQDALDDTPAPVYTHNTSPLHWYTANYICRMVDIGVIALIVTAAMLLYRRVLGAGKKPQKKKTH